MSRTIKYYAMPQTAITAAVKCTLVLETKKSVEREIQVNGSRSCYALEEYLKEIYNARFHTHSHHYCREIHFSSRLGSKFWQSHLSVKCRSRAPDHGVCLKNVSRATAMQGFILTANTATMKCTSILDSTYFFTKLVKREMYVKDTGSWCLLKRVSRKITMQYFILTAVTAAEKCTLFLDKM